MPTCPGMRLRLASPLAPSAPGGPRPWPQRRPGHARASKAARHGLLRSFGNSTAAEGGGNLNVARTGPTSPGPLNWRFCQPPRGRIQKRIGARCAEGYKLAWLAIRAGHGPHGPSTELKYPRGGMGHVAPQLNLSTNKHELLQVSITVGPSSSHCCSFGECEDSLSLVEARRYSAVLVVFNKTIEFQAYGYWSVGLKLFHETRPGHH